MRSPFRHFLRNQTKIKAKTARIFGPKILLLGNEICKSYWEGRNYLGGDRGRKARTLRDELQGREQSGREGGSRRRHWRSIFSETERVPFWLLSFLSPMSGLRRESISSLVGHSCVSSLFFTCAPKKPKTGKWREINGHSRWAFS